MGRASRRRAERRSAPRERFLIRPATPDDDPGVLRELLEPVDFMDAAMPAAIVERLRTGPRLPPRFGTSRLLVAQEHEGGIVAVAHAIPPVEWLMSMESTLGRDLCALLSRALVEMEAVSVADRARGQRLGLRLVDAMVRYYTSQGYQAMLGGIHTHKPYLAPYYEGAGFAVLPAGAMLNLRLPVGILGYPAEPSMRHLARPLSTAVTFGSDASGTAALHGLLAGRMH